MKQWFEEWFNEDYLNLYAHRDDEEARRFLNWLVQQTKLPAGCRILDLGCGTGRHARHLHDLGYQIVGLDQSYYMIERAKNRAPAISFVQGDMRALLWKEDFSVVLSLFTSFGYFEDHTENIRVLQSVRSSLKPGGVFVLDYLNPPYVRSHLRPRREEIVGAETVIIEQHIEGDAAIKEITFPGRRYREYVKLYSLEQLRGMLESTGFQILDIWGNYEGSAWSNAHPRQIFHCRL